MATIYFRKLMLSGPLKGLIVSGSLTGNNVNALAKSFGMHKKGRDAITGNRWVIVDASFQNFAR